MFSPEVYTASFRGDVKLSIPRDLVGSCLLQALISHHCGKNKNKTRSNLFADVTQGLKIVITTYYVAHLIIKDSVCVCVCGGGGGGGGVEPGNKTVLQLLHDKYMLSIFTTEYPWHMQR